MRSSSRSRASLLFATCLTLPAAGQGPPDLWWLAKGAGVWALATSPDNQTLVTSGAFEFGLKLWKTDGTYIRTFAEGFTPYWSMAFSPDGQYLVAGKEAVVGLDEATALIYRVSDGALVRGLNAGLGHDFGFVHTVDYSPAGDLVAVAHNNYTWGIELYNPLTGVMTRALPEGGYVAKFSPDGQTIVGARIGGPRLWRVSDGAVLHTFPSTTGGTLFAFSPDGASLAIGSDTAGDLVRIYRTSDGMLERTITPPTVQYQRSITYAPDKSLLVIAGSRDAAVPLTGNLSDVTIDAFHPDGATAWSYYHPYGIAFQVGFTPDSQTLMVGGGWGTPPNYVEGGTDSIQRLRAADGVEQAHFAARRGLSNEVAFTPDSRLFGSAGNIVMQVWNVADGTVAHTFDFGAGSIDFSRDNTMMCAVVGNIGVWDVPGYNLIHVLPSHNNGTTDAVFSIDNTMIASGGFDNNVKLRRIADGSLVWSRPTNAGVPIVLSASPDGQIIAAGCNGSTVRLWQTAGGTLLRSIVGVNVPGDIAFSPDSTMIAVAEQNYLDNLKLYRVSDGALLRAFPGSWGFQEQSVDFTPDGAYIVFSSGGEFLQFWRVSDGALVRTYDRETGTGLFPLLPIAMSPDGKYLGYGRQDSTIVMARNPFGPLACYANCDGSTTPPILNVADFTCYLNSIAAGIAYANCDRSTQAPILNVQDFTCYLNRFATGCP